MFAYLQSCGNSPVTIYFLIIHGKWLSSLTFCTKLELYVRKVIALSISREWCVFHVDGSRRSRISLVQSENVNAAHRSYNITCNCNCKYDNLYSTVGGKPLLGCLTKMFTNSAISNARD